MFHDCLELSMKSARRVILGVVERSWEGSELMESGGGLGGGQHSSLTPFVQEETRWREGGRNDYFKLLPKLGVGGIRVTVRSRARWLDLGKSVTVSLGILKSLLLRSLKFFQQHPPAPPEAKPMNFHK